MNDYSKNYFWTKIDPVTKEKQYYFKINGILVEVTHDIYNVCYSSYVRELRKDRKNSEIDLQSLDFSNNNNNTLLDIIHSEANVEEEVYNNIEKEIVNNEVAKLSESERKIVMSLYFNEKSLRELAEETGIPVMTIQNSWKSHQR